MGLFERNMNIGWIEISKQQYGGMRYNQEAQRVLGTTYDVESIFCGPQYFKAIRYLRIPEALWRLSRLRGAKDVWVRDFYSTLTMPLDRTKGKNVVVIHHIDTLAFSFPEKWVLFLLEKLFFYRNLRRVDAIVTISEYWKRYFLERGYKNVYKIYPGLDIKDFNVSGEEAEDFKRRHGLEGKPVVYLGNCQRAKGVVEAYEALKDFDVHLVTSGRRQVNIPAQNLNLTYREYLTLLKASSVVLAMSTMQEGWCITAQEAMLCNTPVIGSGKGGMRELLDGGRQMVCEDFKNLREKVEYILSHPEAGSKMGERGHAFASQFTLERFQSDWLKLFEHI